jgi:hypothetical protein
MPTRHHCAVRTCPVSVVLARGCVAANITGADYIIDGGTMKTI